MIALEISDVKECMSHLLIKDTFDRFQFISGSITTFNTFQIDGFLHKDFYDSDELASLSPAQDYSFWKDLRPYCFSLIKGKKTPLEFHLTFSLSRKNIESIINKENLPFTADQVQGLYLNFRYTQKKLTCITGTSFTGFTMDKSLEHTWDHMAQIFFHQHEITAVSV